jgi:hypothetical protein
LEEPGKITLNGILWGLIIPLIIGIVIVAFPWVLRPALDSFFPPGDLATGAGASPYAFVTVILTHGFSLMVVLGVPLFIGLNWSKWAGGCAGFITGTLYYLAFAGYNIQFSTINYGSMPYNLYADPSFIGDYIVAGILVGYIAGALNAKSFHFKRKLAAAMTATMTVGIFSFILNVKASFSAWMITDYGFAIFTALLPMIILGVIVPIISRITAGGELWHP